MWVVDIIFVIGRFHLTITLTEDEVLEVDIQKCIAKFNVSSTSKPVMWFYDNCLF